MKLTDGHGKKCIIYETSLLEELKCLNFIKPNVAFIIVLQYIGHKFARLHKIY